MRVVPCDEISDVCVQLVEASGQGVSTCPQVPAWVWMSISMGSEGTCELDSESHCAPSRVYTRWPGVHSTPTVCHTLKSALTDRAT